MPTPLNATITVSADERRWLIDQIVFEAGQLDEGLDRASEDGVAIIREMHAELGVMVGLLADLELADVTATTALSDVASRLRDEATAAANGVDDHDDEALHRERASCADAVLARLAEPGYGE
jgi:hypothetical protein